MFGWEIVTQGGAALAPGWALKARWAFSADARCIAVQRVGSAVLTGRQSDEALSALRTLRQFRGHPITLTLPYPFVLIDQRWLMRRRDPSLIRRKVRGGKNARRSGS